jgi:predicted ATPase/transcriptional regulator with XRE-family HTH domain
MDSYSFYAKSRSAEPEPKKKYQPHELLVMLRQRSGLSKAELAGVLGFASERMLQKWEGGYSLPTAERLRQLIEIYHARNVFVDGKELEEVRQLWLTVQNYSDATHPSYEGYPVFDAGWFEKLFNGQKASPLQVLPLESAALDPSSPGLEAEKERKSLTNLVSVDLTRLIGRHKELADLTRLLQQERQHLVTISGTGGIGKTRLALQIGRQSLPYFKDGVWLVELADISDTGQLPVVLFKALGIIKKLPNSNALPTLQKHLKTKQLLLILDNCEHLLEACAELANNLLKNCPDVQILATSRERLGILGEVVLPLSPFAVPVIRSNPTPANLLKFEAVQLFWERARSIEPNFELTVENATDLTQICQKLDGIPLALELAALRVNSLSLEQINQRLTARFKLLSKGNRTALPRQQTLRALLDWSFQLLNAEEQHLFIRLAVFSGSWTLEAVEAICNNSDLEVETIIDNLDSLVTKSLVITDKQASITRYRMLETIRQYASERLAQTKDAALFEERHIIYYASLAEQAERIINTPAGIINTSEESLWISRLEKEHENYVMAFNRLFQLQNWRNPAISSLTPAQLTLRLADNLARYWRWRGYGIQMRGWLEKSLAKAEKASSIEGESPQTTKLIASNLLKLCQQLTYQDEYDLALEYAKRGLAFAEKIEDKANMGFANRLLCLIFRNKREFKQASGYVEQSLAIYRAIDDRVGIGSALYELAVLAYRQNQDSLAKEYLAECIEIREKIGAKNQLATSYNLLALLYSAEGDYTRTRYFQEKSIDFCREIGDRGLLGTLLNNLAELDNIEGHYRRAEALALEALALAQEAASREWVAVSLQYLGMAAKGSGDYQKAWDYYQQALAIRQELKDRTYIIYTFNYLGEIAILQGNYQQARQLLNSGLTYAQQAQKQKQLSQTYHYLGYLEYKEGNLAQAKDWLQKAIQMQQDRQNQHEIAKSLTWLICISYQEGKIDEALTQTSKLAELLAATTGALEPHYRAELLKIPFVLSQLPFLQTY